MYEQMDSTDALSRSRCRERRLNKLWCGLDDQCDKPPPPSVCWALLAWLAQRRSAATLLGESCQCPTSTRWRQTNKQTERKTLPLRNRRYHKQYVHECSLVYDSPAFSRKQVFNIALRSSTSVSETIRKVSLFEAKTVLGKNTFCETLVFVPLPKFCEKLLSLTEFHWNGTINCLVIAKKNDF